MIFVDFVSLDVSDKFDIMIIPTPDAYNYTALDDHGITLGNRQKFATLEIKACSDVHILLMQIKANFDIKIFEIIIGNVVILWCKYNVYYSFAKDQKFKIL